MCVNGFHVKKPTKVVHNWEVDSKVHMGLNIDRTKSLTDRFKKRLQTAANKEK